MPAFSNRDKRTLRRAMIGIAIYLTLFGAFLTVKKLERGRKEYQELLARTLREQADLRNYENKVLLFEKLRDSFRLDPRALPRETLAAQAGAAIQAAASQGGIKLGPIRETPGRASGRELFSIQFDAMGPLPAALAMIHEIQTIGYPVVIDSLQLAQDPAKPGMLKITATIVVLNFEHWKSGATPNA